MNYQQPPQPQYAPQQPQPQYAPQQPQRYEPPQRGRRLSVGSVNAVSWKDAQVGTSVEGWLVRIDRSTYPPYNHGIILQQGDGTEILARGCARLENFLRNYSPKAGQYFVITMIGKERMQKGRYPGSIINEFDVQIIEDQDRSSDPFFQPLQAALDAEYAEIRASAQRQQQVPQQMPYGQQYAMPPQQQYQAPVYAPQAPQYPQAPQMPQAPQYAPQMPQAPQAPQYAPQMPQAPQAPQYPQMPQAPQYPQMPQAPQYPQMPQAPQYPQIPQKDDVPL